MLPEMGELVFSLVVGYMGALEFLYVVKHLYHWSFGHNLEARDLKSESESLQRLQDRLRNSISEASEREALGTKAMKDGVLYKDGFRVNADQREIDDLNAKVKNQDRRREIEAELARQKKIEEETRKKLKEAEDELERKRRAEEEESSRKIREAELAKEQEQRRREMEAEELKRKQEQEDEENARRLLEAEREHEERERQREIEEENARRLLEAEREHEERERLLELERQREEQERLQELRDQEIVAKLLAAEREREEEEENNRRLIEAEREHEERERLRELEEENNRKLLETERELQVEQQRLEEEQARQRLEEEENYRRLLQMEREMEERERLAEEERKALMEHAAALEKETNERLLAAEREAALKQQQIEENEENMRNLLSAERELEIKKQEMEEEAENLRKLIEAEKEMEERQRRLDHEALQKFKSAEEEMELRQAHDVEASEQPIVKKEISSSEQTPTVKTQFGQTGSDSLRPKTILFPGVSEESSSAEPMSSKQSSFSTQLSSEAVHPELHFDEYERQAPDGGEDMPSLQYSDDYLRSLDGIKNKPLVREDGSGRRRAFKKRRSSGSSTSSRESRASREEELKMFTSLEEEEFENIRKGDSEYEAIKYASEPNLKVGRQHRRHRRSPAKDSKRDPNDPTKGSLEMLDEEDSNPWGEVKPEHYKDTEFWKREKHLSIDEELEETEAKHLEQAASLSAANIPKMSSFEEASKSQHEEAFSTLQRQRSKDPETTKEPADEESDTKNLIFSGEYTKAMNKDWHSGHFCCWQCDESLTGQRYVIRDEHPYCIKCYENVFANTCEECSKIIGIDSKDLSYKDKHWHEACFLCNKCRISLVDKQFGAKADKIYCGNCYDAQFASRCDGCGEVFRAGTKKMEYKTRQWHEKCFCCCVCKTPIGTKSFIPREQEIYCAGCYEEKFATRCIKCNKVITAGGVTYKNEPWHRECFTCTNCNITLAGQRFTSRDEKPYCAECFGELFAKRCTACVKPITGIGGTRFISFEDRHWHHDCFICANCKTSLVGRGFITDGPDIICPECAKQKLI